MWWESGTDGVNAPTGADPDNEEAEEDMAEWSAKTASWAKEADSSDDEEDAPAVPAAAENGGFSGLADLEDLDSGDESADDALGDRDTRGIAVAAASFGGAHGDMMMDCDEPPSLEAAACVRHDPDKRPLTADVQCTTAKRVRFSESEQMHAAGVSPPNGRAASDPTLRALVRGSSPADSSPESQQPSLDLANGTAGKRRGYKHYSLDDVKDSELGERANLDALAQMRNALSEGAVQGAEANEANDADDNKQALFGSARMGHHARARKLPVHTIAVESEPATVGSQGRVRAGAAGQPRVSLSHLLEDEDGAQEQPPSQKAQTGSRGRQQRQFRKPAGADVGDVGGSSMLDELD